MEYLWFAIGLAVGAVAVGLALHFRGIAQRVELDTTRKMQKEMDQRVSQAFGSMASEALKSNSESFLQLARTSLDTQLTRAQGDLDLKRQAVEGLVKPLSDTLGQMEKSRQEAYGGLKQQIEVMAQGQTQLAGETRNLVEALRSPQVRGRWGEMTLRRVAELAGMVERCDFVEQQVISGEDRDGRPDMVVLLPNDRRIAVDAKTPLDGYLQSVEADTEEERTTALKRHARQMRDRIKELSAKSYWSSLGYTPEFVVLFLPGEFLLGPALQQQPMLLEDAMKDRVVLATPSTLISLLHAVAYGWRQEALTENAREISDMGRELHDRVATWASHIERIGDSLSKAVDTFNQSVGSLEHRVLVSTRRFKELGVTTEKEVPEISPIERQPRLLSPVTDDDTEGRINES